MGEGALAFFKASSSGLGAAGTVPALLTGLGSRLMTGVAELDVGKGAARRLLKVVVEVVAVEPAEGAGRVEVVAEGETVFSGSGAKRKKRVKDMLGLFPPFWLKHIYVD